MKFPKILSLIIKNYVNNHLIIHVVLYLNNNKHRTMFKFAPILFNNLDFIRYIDNLVTHDKCILIFLVAVIALNAQ